jgi:hypothetical protein
VKRPFNGFLCLPEQSIDGYNVVIDNGKALEIKSIFQIKPGTEILLIGLEVEF